MRTKVLGPRARPATPAAEPQGARELVAEGLVFALRALRRLAVAERLGVGELVGDLLEAPPAGSRPTFFLANQRRSVRWCMPISVASSGTV